ncbi:MAG: hypothetical protein IKE03_09690 [Blautia sp.]|nr:hypothetical protein [Blautia sp.]
MDQFALLPNTILNARYLVKSLLAYEEPCFKYACVDLQRQQDCVIWEFFDPSVMARMPDLTAVGFLGPAEERFRAERDEFARNAAFQSQNPDFTYFKENHTYYLVDCSAPMEQASAAEKEHDRSGYKKAAAEKTHKRPGHKYTAAAVVLCLLVAAVGGFFFLSHHGVPFPFPWGNGHTELSDHTSGKPVPAGTTIMIYMTGADLEHEGGLGSLEMEEIAASGISVPLNEILICTGGTKLWQNGIPADKNTICHLESDGSYTTVHETSALQNMCAPDMLAEFVNYCTAHYPSDHYGLILWDHGSGPILGYGLDENFEYDTMMLSEMKQAMDQTVFAGEEKIDWVVFDACDMGSVEIARTWAPYSEYLVASQESIPGLGLDYSFLSELNDTGDPVRICRNISERYMRSYQEMEDSFTVPVQTISCIRLSATQDLAKKLDDLFVRMQGELNEDTYPRHARLRADTRRIGLVASAGKMYSSDMIDLGAYLEGCREICPAQAGACIDALEKCVVMHEENRAALSGLSIYLPYDNLEFYDAVGQEVIGDVNESENACTYLREMVKLRNRGTSGADWHFAEASSDKDSLTLKLTKEQQADTAEVYFTALSHEDVFGAITGIPGKWLSIDSGTYFPLLKECRIWPDKKGRIKIPWQQELACVYSGPEHTVHVVPVRQTDKEGDLEFYVTETAHLTDFSGFGGEFVQDADVYMNFAWDKKKQAVEIISVTNGQAAPVENFGGKNEMLTTDWQTLEYGFSTITPPGMRDGIMAPYDTWPEDVWARSGSVTMDENLAAGSVISSGPDFCYQIIVEDVYGVRHATPIYSMPET